MSRRRGNKIMKKIIDGLMYDTEAATEIYVDSKNSRKYYQTEKGNFFCFFSNGEIKPISEKSMRDFLGEVSVDTYIRVFEMPELA